MRKHFIVRQHQEFGSLGFIEKTAPDEFEPLPGMGTAHDCLEHFPGDDGSIDHEFQALGCCLWIRGEGGYHYFNNRGAEENTSSDISILLWRLYYWQGYTMRPPKPKNRLKINESVKETLEIARKDIILEQDADYQIEPEKLQAFLDSAAYWMTVGYNRGTKRYPDPGRACFVFQLIEAEVDSVLKHAQGYEEYDIVFSVKNGKAYLEEVLEMEELYD